MPGTPLTQPKNHVMAGKGRIRKIDIIDLLLFKYKNTREDEWTYEKGFGYVYDDYGESRAAELHWFQNPKVGKCEVLPHLLVFVLEFPLLKMYNKTYRLTTPKGVAICLFQSLISSRSIHLS